MQHRTDREVPTANLTADGLQRRFAVLLERFTRREVQILSEALERIDADAGKELHRGGDPIDALYLIWDGRLALAMPVGGELISLGTLGPGDLIGAVAIITPGSAMVTLTVTEPSILLRLDHAGLQALRKAQPRVGGQLLRALSLDLAERLRLYEEGITERTQPADVGEFIRLCRPLLGAKDISP